MAELTEDYSADFERRLQMNVQRALESMGTAAVAAVIRNMQEGYEKPIWRTGDLQRDVRYEVDDTTIQIGNSLEYAIYIHG